MRRAVLAVLATVVGLVLLLSFKPHDVGPAGAPPAAVAGGGTGGTLGAPGGRGRDHAEDGDRGDDEDDDDDGVLPRPGATGGTGTAGGDTGTAGKAGQVVTGDAVDTRWGPVQVRISLSGGKITGVDAVVVPDANRRDREINRVAVPILDAETLAAQSAQIDTVSGATYTSEGYIGSLQSALDRAGR
ncbi:hypothetical protein Sru01_36080 [Sphaerisporangium rufum]|uniref:FMN-binding domain-containing protein n=1 Tax=Sphaerisporangium rufum TaxID=1381558 RepID=A0A919UZ13_9ACTN|nr:FMN-binding protein [Sphaerisporangium rufum]GII78626.1 hypothetical protein Sru01_36080 [Sphaerisporangium rufum]